MQIVLIALIIICEICLISFNPLFEKNPVNPCNLWSLISPWSGGAVKSLFSFLFFSVEPRVRIII